MVYRDDPQQEQALLEGLSSADPNVQGATVEALLSSSNAAKVSRYAKRKASEMGNYNDWEDAVQESVWCLVMAVRGKKFTYQGPGCVVGFLVKVVRRELHKHAVRNYATADLPEEEALLTDETSYETETVKAESQAVDFNRLAQYIRGAINLPIAFKRLLMARIVGGYKYSDLAEVFDEKADTLGKRVKRTLCKLEANHAASDDGGPVTVKRVIDLICLIIEMSELERRVVLAKWIGLTYRQIEVMLNLDAPSYRAQMKVLLAKLKRGLT
ncbi:MAG: sigma-70 family RNA polymerase sigma factor [Anaerolinea sp.]|nr:sigma-70 family RNA polymerase sigma factor [Anaerolinea sp.]